MNRHPLPASLSGFLVLMLSLALAPAALAFSSGPLDGKTGAPGEGNCTDCHDSFSLDSGDGSYGLSIGQVQYSPDEDYTVVVELADPQAMRWGFELTFIDDAGVAAGTLASLDDDTQVTSSNDRQYGKHTSQGTHPGTPDGHAWMMSWTAPAEGTGDVRLYAMGNAANNDGTNQSDYVYSFMTTLAEGPPTGIGAPAHLATLHANYPNPFNPQTAIPYELEREATVRLSIYDSRGRLITVLEDGRRGAGSHESRWAGTDARGRIQPSGVYLARLTDGRGHDLAPARKMILGK